MAKWKKPRYRRRKGELSSLASSEYLDLSIKYDEAVAQCTPMQKEFVAAYLALGEHQAAILEAGYKGENPSVVAAQMARKPHVSAAIEAGRAMLRERHRIKADDLIEELKLIAFSDHTDYELDDHGKPVKKPGQAYKWRAVKRIKRRIIPKKDGPPEIHEEIELHSKLDAIRLLGQHTGAWLGEAGDDSVRPPSVIVIGVDADRIAGKPPALPAPRPEVIDAEIAGPEASPSTPPIDGEA